MPAKLTISIDEKLRRDLDALAEATQRSSESLAAIALHMFVEQETKIVADILEGQRQARAGETVPHEEVSAWIDSLATAHPLPVPKARRRAS